MTERLEARLLTVILSICCQCERLKIVQLTTSDTLSASNLTKRCKVGIPTRNGKTEEETETMISKTTWGWQILVNSHDYKNIVEDRDIRRQIWTDEN